MLKKHENSIIMKIMPLLLFFSLISIYNSTLYAEGSIKVKKAKGKSAIIESSYPLQVGESYNLESAPISETPQYNFSSHSKSNSLSITGSISAKKADNLRENQLTLETRYGWNAIQYEYGPIFLLSMIDEGGGFNSEFHLGGFFDYNLVPNRAKDQLIFGLTTQALIGNRNSQASGGNSQILTFYGGGFLSYFLFNTTTALRTELNVLARKISTDKSSTTVKGVQGKLLLSFYF